MTVFNDKFSALSLLAFSCVLWLSGCSTQLTRLDLTDKNSCAKKTRDISCDPVSMATPGYFSKASAGLAQTLFGHENRTDKLGIALAGGGTKAADFGIGILQGLFEAGLLQEADVLSTVSGGSYAGYWYFSRLAESGEQAPDLTKYFNDCFPVRYAGLLADSPKNSSSMKPCPKTAPNGQDVSFTQIPTAFEGQVGKDDFRYQNHLRGQQDLFAVGPMGIGPESYDYREPEEGESVGFKAWDVLKLLPLSVGSYGVNFVANVMFDWQLDLSAFGSQYRAGLERTFSNIPEDCGQPSVSLVDSHCVTWRGVGTPRGLSFRGLLDLRKVAKAPMWILNATGGDKRSITQSWIDGSDPEFNLVEFTPYQYGAGEYGYSNYTPDELDWPVLDIVRASAAFLDPHQKKFGSSDSRGALGASMKLLTLDWSVTKGNPRVGTFDKVFHHFLPWPFYYLHKYDAGPDAVYTYLTDAGSTEDLGAYALVRRQIKTIIISDQSNDRSGRMEDLCGLRESLVKVGLTVSVPGLNSESLNRSCAGEAGFNIFDWQYPILLGCVTSDSANTDCESRTKDGDYFARIIIIKPALSKGILDGGNNSWDKIVAACRGAGVTREECLKQAGQNMSCSADAAGTAVSDAEKGKAFSPPPCEVAGFLLDSIFARKHWWPGNQLAGDRFNDDDGCVNFPQDSTVHMTSNSDYWRYGAYRELGRYYARRIARYVSKDGSPVENNFSTDLRNQKDHAMTTAPADAWRLKANCLGI